LGGKQGPIKGSLEGNLGDKTSKVFTSFNFRSFSSNQDKTDIQNPLNSYLITRKKKRSYLLLKKRRSYLMPTKKFWLSMTYYVAPTCALFAWLISHQPAVLFSHNKPATSNQPAVLFSQKAISHQPTEQADSKRTYPFWSRYVTNNICSSKYRKGSRVCECLFRFKIREIKIIEPHSLNEKFQSA
jgi:hypothetical protein